MQLCAKIIGATLFILILIGLVLLIVPHMAYSIPDSIKCYSGGQLIYQSDTKEIYEEDGFIYFDDIKTGKAIYLKGFDCIIMSDETISGEIKNAAAQKG